jgi:hypothetical protein
MKRPFFHKASALMALALLSTTPALAGIYTDDLSRCLVEKTTTEDKTTLVQWMLKIMGGLEQYLDKEKLEALSK